MKLHRTLPAIGSLLALLTLPGCFPWWLFENNDPEPIARPEPEELSDPPRVDSVSIPDWPPVGPGTEIVATASDDEGLSSVEINFVSSIFENVSSTQASVTVTGSELGEGYGSLHVIAYDRDEQWSDQEVSGFLVDLSPPKGEMVQNVFKRAEGEDVQIWVQDAWVLGRVELSFGGVTKAFQFEQGYPSTLGETWDVSLVTLPTMDFPEVSGKGELRVWDAAGNKLATEVDLTLDGTPPVAAITSPLPDSVVSGLVTIGVMGSDEGTSPVEIDLYVGGTPIVTLSGPSGEVTIDVSELAKGDARIEAIARDIAGNTSEVASIDVVIE